MNRHQTRTSATKSLRANARHAASIAWPAGTRSLRAEFWLLLASLLLPIALPAHAATISVCAKGCQQTTISAAINAANPGDTIMIGAGTYIGNLVISKDLTLQGAGASTTILNASGNGLDTVLISAGVTAQLSGLTLEGASGGQGGIAGLHVQGTVTLNDSIVTQNDTGVWDDGGVANVLHTTITANGGAGSGGVNNTGSGVTLLAYSTISLNSSNSLGGGITIEDGSVSLLNSTLSSNSTLAASFAGANLLFYPSGTSTGSPTVAFVNSTVFNGSQQELSMAAFPGATNAAVLAGGSLIASQGLQNCAGNLGFVSYGYNLASDNSCGLNNSTDIVSSASLNLGPLQVNAPGTTATHALLRGNPAIDQGNCQQSYVVDDQRGVARPQGPACDIGAYEMRTPVATNSTFTTLTNQPLVVDAPGVLAGDYSPEGLPIYFFTLSRYVSNGTLYIAPGGNGSFEYNPNPGFVGQDSFTYTAFDGSHLTNIVTVTINVLAQNTPPTAENDSYSLVEGKTLSVSSAQGVLANDSDPEGYPLTAIDESLPAHGALTLNSDGSFTYTPAAGFVGTDSFLYAASDGQYPSVPATVTLNVAPSTGTITIALQSQPQTTTAFQFTGSLGSFALGGSNAASQTFQVAAGAHTIHEILPAGWKLGSLVCNPMSGVTVTPASASVKITTTATSNVTCTFLDQQNGSITAEVYNDENQDHEHESTEPWLSGWTLELYSSPTTKLAAHATNASGQATFSSLAPGAYTVCEVLKSEWYSITPAMPTPAYNNQPCSPVTVAPGMNTTIAFGVSTTP